MFSTRYKSLRDIDLLEEYIDSYPNNQKEIGESIYEIYELIKNNLIKDDMKKNLFFLVILLCLSLFSVKRNRTILHLFRTHLCIALLKEI